MKISIIILFLSFFTIHFDLTQSFTIHLSKVGTVPDFDITKDLKSGWKEACASTSTEPVEIYFSGTYTLKPVELKGPCKGPVKIIMDGTVRALVKQKDVGGDHWIKISHVNDLTIGGYAILDGQGKSAWKHNECSKNSNCKLSMNFVFNSVNNSIVKHITSKDSKHFHAKVLNCKNFTFNEFKVSAPQNSPNTSGIHVEKSTSVNVLNSNIGTGDDCVSLGDGSRQVLVQNVTCGPGHGISIGSPGKHTKEEPIDGITIKGCTLKETDNGVKIKTWSSEPETITISNLAFEDITMENVKNPIIIDQEYCPSNKCSQKQPSRVKINKVIIKNIKGTSATKEGMILACSSVAPCEGVEISNVDLKFNGTPTIAVCNNVKPKITGNVPECTTMNNKKH
ncbi:polygalacturonase-like [Vigna radiata var. radiata]|uniref:Polygalacturonase-like n=1 Tax=Vigna radiata var. radiata TaxID=3916 RepID=A0A3Q0FDW6_VIGRR|nr:polygalacturonase-like [Vigna radiata var. radiata]